MSQRGGVCTGAKRRSFGRDDLMVTPVAAWFQNMNTVVVSCRRQGRWTPRAVANIEKTNVDLDTTWRGTKGKK